MEGKDSRGRRCAAGGGDMGVVGLLVNPDSKLTEYECVEAVSDSSECGPCCGRDVLDLDDNCRDGM